MSQAALRAGVAPAAQIRGILVSVLAGVFLTAQDAITKLLTGEFSPGEVLFYRGLAAVLPVGVAIWATGGRVTLRTSHLRVNLLRGVLAFASALCVIWSFAYMPLAEALAVVYVNPLVMTALAMPMLGERVTARQWTVVAIGFMGALLIIQPGAGANFDWHVLMPLGAALCGSIRDLLTRRLGATEQPATVLIYTMIAMFIGGVGWVSWTGTHIPGWSSGGLILLAAVLVTAAYYLAITGLKLAAAATVAPYRYLSLVWASLLGWLVWGHVMAPVKLMGCALVVGSGIYLLQAEARELRQAMARPSAN